MKASYEILIVAAVLGAAEFIWMETHADQATVDEGVDLAKSLQGGVQNLSTTTGANTVPGYNGTNLPQVQYFNTQNLNGMQTDATVQLGTGTASEASQYAYQQSLLPRLNFNANDPILTHSSGISTDAMLNPEVLTVPTGNCTVANVNNPETRIEHCTAWMLPTNHTCNKTLDVGVTWQDISSCSIGARFNDTQIVHNAFRVWDFTHARAVCNPGSGPDAVEIEVFATDTINPSDPPDCTGWTKFTVSTNQPAEIFSGVTLRPSFHGGACSYVPTSVQGGCINNQCNYTLKFYELTPWVSDTMEDGTVENRCPSVTTGFINLESIGYTTGPVYTKLGSDSCVFSISTLNLIFEKPTLTRTPTVTENWTNGCAALEAQLP